MSRLLSIAMFLAVLLSSGCGKDEKTDDGSKLPPADQLFDKTKGQDIKGGLIKKDKGTAG